MVAAAPGRDRGLLQPPQPRRRLAGVEDLGAGPGHRLDETRGEGGDAGEVTEEVESGALGDQQRRRWPARQQHLGRHPVAPLPLDHEPVDVLDPALAHRLLDQVEAEGDAGLFLHDPGAGAGLRGHRRLRRHVAGANVLGQGAATISLSAPQARPSRHPTPTLKGVSELTGPITPSAQTPPEEGPGLSRSVVPRRLIHEVTELPPFQTLIDEHAGDVMAVCRGAVGRGDADDCFQETFLAALRAYPKLSDGGNLRGWLITIAHRKAIDHHRARGRRAMPVAEPTEVAVNDPEPDGDVWAVVGALPPKQRAAVTLRYASDLPHAEIAAALGCSPEAARRSLHEGMKRLRKELA